jgi:hypothetical protein
MSKIRPSGSSADRQLREWCHRSRIRDQTHELIIRFARNTLQYWQSDPTKARATRLRLNLVNSHLTMVFTIVQLSDIHTREQDPTLLPKVTQLAAAICSADPTSSNFVLILNADMAFSGTEAEYAKSKIFLTQLIDAIKRGRPQASVVTVGVPGNHDCHLP